MKKPCGIYWRSKPQPTAMYSCGHSNEICEGKPIFRKGELNEFIEKLLYEPLRSRSILIRFCTNFIDLDEKYFCIGFKTHNKNMVLQRAIAEVLNG